MVTELKIIKTKLTSEEAVYASEVSFPIFYSLLPFQFISL